MSRRCIAWGGVLGLLTLYWTGLGNLALPAAERTAADAPAAGAADRPAAQAPDRKAAPAKPRLSEGAAGLGPRTPGSSDIHRTDRALITVESARKGEVKPSPKQLFRPPPGLFHGRPSDDVATGEAAIEKALARPTTIEASDTALADVVGYLNQFHHVQIQFDVKALEELGVATDSPITRELRGVSLRSALDLILRDLGLTWTIDSEVLLITSPDVAANLVTTRSYEVSDLVVCRDEKDQLWDDYESLVKMVTSHVAPESWADAGGAGAVTGMSLGGSKVLVVTSEYRVQRAVRQLLEDLREHAARGKGEKKAPFRPRPSRQRAEGGMPMSAPGGFGGTGMGSFSGGMGGFSGPGGFGGGMSPGPRDPR